MTTLEELHRPGAVLDERDGAAGEGREAHGDERSAAALPGEGRGDGVLGARDRQALDARLADDGRLAAALGDELAEEGRPARRRRGGIGRIGPRLANRLRGPLGTRSS